MDALSLAACVIQFLDFTCGLVAKGIAIHESSAGHTVDHDELDRITTGLSESNGDITQRLEEAQRQRQLTRNEGELKTLAAECQDIAEQLLSTLDRIKCKGPRTTWKSFRHAILSVWKEKEVQALERRLDRFRQQMLLNVLESLRHKSDLAIQEQSLTRKSMKRVEDILHRSIGDNFVEEVENASQWKNDLLRTIHEEGAGQVRLLGLNNMVHSKSPSSIREEEKRIRARVVHKLAFTNMTDRERRIPKAHQRTFEWIFQEPNDADRPWSSFRKFLRDQNNKMYWITGKPGSGKSTLMKFVHQNPQTSRLIEEWSAGGEVVKAAFFFWNSGSHMQMSVDGLLQTLLHDCLCQLPRFVQQTLPERWEAATLFDEDDFPWCFDEVSQALRRLMVDLCPDKKFFLMIDGLDECSGDQSGLITLLHDLSNEAPNVKFCLASRPYNNFEDGFRGKPSLMLQDLTRADMELYVTSTFQANEGFMELQSRDPNSVDDLLQGILTKSEGVFLWVYLVARSLIVGLTNGDGLRELHRRLAELPPDLEELYKSILNHLDPRYLDHASRLFQIVKTYRECGANCWNESPTLLRVALADLDDEAQVFHTPVKPQTEEEILAICKNMKRKLVSRCHGLLEVSVLHETGDIQSNFSAASSGQEDGTNQVNDRATSVQTGCSLANQEVQYLHRTVRDYFESRQVWDWLLSVNQKPFNPFLALLRSSLLQLKQLEEKFYPSALFRSISPSAVRFQLGSSGISYSIMGVRVLTTIKVAKTALKVSQNQSEESETVSILEELDKTVTLLMDISKNSICIQTGQGILGVDHWANFFLLDVPKVTFLHMMAICGVHQYVARHIHDSELNEVRNDASFILTLLEGKVDRANTGVSDDTFTGPHTDVLRLVLRNCRDPLQEYEGRSAWSVAKKLKQPKVLRLFQELGLKPPTSNAVSGSTGASTTTSDSDMSELSSNSGPSNAAQGRPDKGPSASTSNNRGDRGKAVEQGSRAFTTLVGLDPEAIQYVDPDFSEPNDTVPRDPVLRRSRLAKRTGKSARREASESRDYYGPRNDQRLRYPVAPHGHRFMVHSPGAYNTGFASSRSWNPLAAPPHAHPPYYNYQHHHSRVPGGHYIDYGAYAPERRHHDAQLYYNYCAPAIPSWPSDPRYYTPPPMSPHMMLPYPFHPVGRSISYRSGRQGEHNPFMSFIPPFHSAGFLSRPNY